MSWVLSGGLTSSARIGRANGSTKAALASATFDSCSRARILRLPPRRWHDRGHGPNWFGARTMKKMARVLGAGKWLATLALAGCSDRPADGSPFTSAGAASVSGAPGAGGELPSSAGSAAAVGGSAGAGSESAGGSGDGGAVSLAGTGGAALVAGAGGASGNATTAAGGASAGGAPAGGQAGSIAQGGESSAGTGGTPAGGAGGQTNGGASSGGTGGGAACECSTGQCCDGCHFRPSSFFLGKQNYSSSCSGSQMSPTCASYMYRIEFDERNFFCTGTSATESRNVHIDFLDTECAIGDVCRVIGTGLLAAQCGACPVQ